MAGKRSFRADFAQGAYTLSWGEGILRPRLYYAKSPAGENRRPLPEDTAPGKAFPSPLPGKRVYFFLEEEGQEPLAAAARGVEIPGVQNFRDLGGYPAQEGRRVRELMAKDL